MATLLSAASANGAGTPENVSGSVSIHIHGDSVFDGARVEVQGCDVNTAAKYSPLDLDAIREPGCFNIEGVGSRYIRLVVFNAGANTNITAESTS